MLTLSEIEKSYPENLRGFKRFILREYLQHKLLQILFDSEYANELCFQTYFVALEIYSWKFP